jgi:hypothetical protein
MAKKSEDFTNTISKLNEQVKDLANVVTDYVRQVERAHASKYDSLVSEVRNILDIAESNYASCKSDGLTINMIESEGYLRAIKDVMTIIDN